MHNNELPTLLESFSTEELNLSAASLSPRVPELEEDLELLLPGRRKK